MTLWQGNPIIILTKSIKCLGPATVFQKKKSQKLTKRCYTNNRNLENNNIKKYRKKIRMKRYNINFK